MKIANVDYNVGRLIDIFSPTSVPASASTGVELGTAQPQLVLRVKLIHLVTAPWYAQNWSKSLKFGNRPKKNLKSSTDFLRVK